MNNQLIFAAKICFSLILLSGVMFGQVQTKESVGNDATKPWQSDFKKFLVAMQACATTNCPLGDFKDIEVAWEGTFTSWEEKTSIARFDMGLGEQVLTVDGTANKIDCCSPRVADPTKWKTLAPGTKVKFQATTNSVIPLFIFKGVALISLENAEIVPADANLQPRQRKYFTGRVVDISGAAVSGVHVRATGEELFYYGDTVEDGSFRMLLRSGEGIPKLVTFMATREKTFGIAANVNPSEPAVLTLLPGGTVDVVVKDSNGKLVKDVDVTPMRWNGHVVKHLAGLNRNSTDKDGLCRLFLPAGTIDFKIELYKKVQKDLKVIMSGQATIEIVPNETRQIVVTITPVMQ